MTKLIQKSVVILLLSNITPQMATAQDFNALMAERNRIFNQVIQGSASDADISRFQSLCKQINSLMDDKFKQNAERVNNLTTGLKRLESQQNQVYNALFGITSPNSVSPSGDDVILQSQTPQLAPTRALQGRVIDLDLDSIVTIALNKNPQYGAYSEAVNKYNTPYQKAVAQGKDALDYMLPYRGFGPSSEGGDVILGENSRVKGLSSAVYLKQKLIDETHLKVTAAILEMAMGIGSNNDKTTLNGYNSLKSLIGDEADKVKQSISSLSGSPRDANWSILEKQDRFKALIKGSIEGDQVVKDVVAAVNKYNHKSKASMTVSHIVEPLLGAVSLTPMFIGPMARGILLDYVMMTGGSEENKLLKEIYLDRRLESRVMLITEEGHMTLDAVQIGYLTNNSTLSAVAESLIDEMLHEKVSQVL